MGEVVREAKKSQIPVRGYVSCVVGCPYEGYIKPSMVCRVVEKLLEQGCYEVSLGDTIGVGMIIRQTFQKFPNLKLNFMSKSEILFYKINVFN